MKRLFTICILFFLLFTAFIEAQTLDQLLNVATNGRVVGGSYIVEYLVQGNSLPSANYLNNANFDISYNAAKLNYISATWTIGAAYTPEINTTNSNVIKVQIMGTSMGGNRNTTVGTSFNKWLTLNFIIIDPSSITLSIISAGNQITLSDKQGTGSKTTYSGSSLTSTFVDNSPLPVELTSFAGRCVQNKIHLNWNTATEVSNLGFDIERSSDKINWQKIAFINGNGNSNSPKNYSYVDNSAMESKCYYRLKQIDTDGQCHYSNTIEINTSQNSGSFTLEQNYPNPFNPVTNISFFLPSESFVSIKVFDVLGREVTTLIQKQLTAGYQNVYFDASNLASGTYLYRMEAGAFTQVRKLIVTK